MDVHFAVCSHLPSVSRDRGILGTFQLMRRTSGAAWRLRFRIPPSSMAKPWCPVGIQAVRHINCELATEDLILASFGTAAKLNLNAGGENQS